MTRERISITNELSRAIKNGNLERVLSFLSLDPLLLNSIDRVSYLSLLFSLSFSLFLTVILLLTILTTLIITIIIIRNIVLLYIYHVNIIK